MSARRELADAAARRDPEEWLRMLRHESTRANNAEELAELRWRALRLAVRDLLVGEAGPSSDTDVDRVAITFVDEVMRPRPPRLPAPSNTDAGEFEPGDIRLDTYKTADPPPHSTIRVRAVHLPTGLDAVAEGRRGPSELVVRNAALRLLRRKVDAHTRSQRVGPDSQP